MTTLPAIGVPVPFAQFDGLDWLLSIVKMLAVVSVATVAVDHSDARVRPGTDVYLDALTQTRPTLDDADIAALTQDIERFLRS